MCDNCIIYVSCTMYSIHYARCMHKYNTFCKQYLLYNTQYCILPFRGPIVDLKPLLKGSMMHKYNTFCKQYLLYNTQYCILPFRGPIVDFKPLLACIFGATVSICTAIKCKVC